MGSERSFSETLWACGWGCVKVPTVWPVFCVVPTIWRKYPSRRCVKLPSLTKRCFRRFWNPVFVKKCVSSGRNERFPTEPRFCQKCIFSWRYDIFESFGNPLVLKHVFRRNVMVLVEGFGTPFFVQECFSSMGIEIARKFRNPVFVKQCISSMSTGFSDDFGNPFFIRNTLTYG